jgi:hypothetical protein
LFAIGDITKNSIGNVNNTVIEKMLITLPYSSTKVDGFLKLAVNVSYCEIIKFFEGELLLAD